MSSSRQVKHPPADPADLLAFLFDELDPALFRRPERLYDLLYGDAGFQRTVETARDEAELSGTTSHAQTIASTSLSDPAALACLIGLDRALDTVTAAGATPPPGLMQLPWRFRTTGTLTTGAVGGAVLPACVSADRAVPVPEGPGEVLTAVVRVPPAVWSQADHDFIPDADDFDRDEIEDELVVACVPIIDDLDQLSIARRGKAFYDIAPKPGGWTRARIARLLARLDGSGAHLAVLPELTTTPEVVDHWTEVIRRTPRPAGSKLRLLFAGTGHFPSGHTEPFNRGTLLSRRDGRKIAVQDKRFPFNLTDEQIGEWQLGALGAGPLAELMERGERFRFLESTLGRLVILICEDLGRSFDVGPDVRAFGTSHIVAPVFSKPVQSFYWEHQRARDYVAHGGATTIVANSVAVGQAQRKNGGKRRHPVGAALAVSRGGKWKVGSASRADHILVFTIATDGSGVSCTRIS